MFMGEKSLSMEKLFRRKRESKGEPPDAFYTPTDRTPADISLGPNGV